MYASFPYTTLFLAGIIDKSTAPVTVCWHLLDEIRKAVLFLLIGIEVFAISFGDSALLPALVAIPLVLLARLIAVLLPLSVMRLRSEQSRGAAMVMTWGGLRGGVSVALALSLPDGEWKTATLPPTSDRTSVGEGKEGK